MRFGRQQGTRDARCSAAIRRALSPPAVRLAAAAPGSTSLVSVSTRVMPWPAKCRMSIAGSSFLGSQSRRRTASSKQCLRHRALVEFLERQQFESAQSCGTHVFQACPLGCGTDRNGAQGAILRLEGAQDRHGALRSRHQGTGCAGRGRGWRDAALLTDAPCHRTQIAEETVMTVVGDASDQLERQAIDGQVAPARSQSGTRRSRSDRHRLAPADVAEQCVEDGVAAQLVSPPRFARVAGFAWFKIGVDDRSSVAWHRHRSKWRLRSP